MWENAVMLMLMLAHFEKRGNGRMMMFKVKWKTYSLFFVALLFLLLHSVIYLVVCNRTVFCTCFYLCIFLFCTFSFHFLFCLFCKCVEMSFYCVPPLAKAFCGRLCGQSRQKKKRKYSKNRKPEKNESRIEIEVKYAMVKE